MSLIIASDPHSDSSEELFSMSCQGEGGHYDKSLLPNLYGEACPLTLASAL